MQPIVSIEQMRAADERAIAEVGIDALIARAGYAAFMTAHTMLGGLYGKSVVVIAGKGHNGDDGRACARYLRARSAKVTVVSVEEARDSLPAADLVIDAAYGTGFHGEFQAPDVTAGTRVLAIDIPSGLDATTGAIHGSAMVADVTVTFGAYKPGLLLGDGPDYAGRVVVAPIGLRLEKTSSWLIEDVDLAGAIPRRGRTSHKWQHALYLLAGSPGMTGAPRLCAYGALRAGASMVRLGVPGVATDELGVTEAVGQNLPRFGFLASVRGELRRCKVLVVGPGLSTDPKVAAEVRELVAEATLPMVIDADGLNALGELPAEGGPFLRNHEVLITPHDGEFARLFGRAPGADRIGDVRELSRRLGGVVLLKGPTTIVASTAGPSYLVNSGTPSLASAGTGDVLSGVVGALMSRGLAPLLAGAFGAHLHGCASALGPKEGLIASDLPALIARVLSSGEPVTDPGAKNRW